MIGMGKLAALAVTLLFLRGEGIVNVNHFHVSRWSLRDYANGIIPPGYKSLLFKFVENIMIAHCGIEPKAFAIPYGLGLSGQERKWLTIQREGVVLTAFQDDENADKWRPQRHGRWLMTQKPVSRGRDYFRIATARVVQRDDAVSAGCHLAWPNTKYSSSRGCSLTLKLYAPASHDNKWLHLLKNDPRVKVGGIGGFFGGCNGVRHLSGLIVGSLGEFSSFPPHQNRGNRQNKGEKASPSGRGNIPWHLAVLGAVGCAIGAGIGWPYKKKPRNLSGDNRTGSDSRPR